MEYSVQEWKVKDLLKIYSEEKLDLNPPYQRNDIWGPSAKKRLIDSIKNGYPLPAFFLYKKDDNNYEMVDGQQRTRAILGYIRGFYKDAQKNLFDEESESEIFHNYIISVTIIENVKEEGVLEDFYYRVNKFGSKLNRPEILKAQYFDTTFQDLVERMATEPSFEKLNLFSAASLNRMNDLDFVGELLSLLRFGITEKKKGPDKLYEDENFNTDEAREIEERFKVVINHFTRFDKYKKISTTRYRQRNDFYSLFGFIDDNTHLDNGVLDYFYRLLLVIEDDISPTNDECYSLQEYATNCVSQSNSKRARQERLNFLNNLLLNKFPDPSTEDETKSPKNEVITDLLNYYKLENDAIIKIDDFYLLDEKKIRENKEVQSI
ncbi:MAG: DUF262 domain-containing protein [Candidatus Paceibacterota bacterium]